MQSQKWKSYFAPAAEVGLLWNGLEFARVRTSVADNSFARSEEILFGSGANATLLTEESAPKLREMVGELITRRRPSGDKRDTLYRQQPERWLESMLRRSLDSIDAMIEPQPVYAQVPAFSAADRAVLDLLAVRRDGRLVVIEIKADEDLHLALQSLDYWVRVRQHQHGIAQQTRRHCGKKRLGALRIFSRETVAQRRAAPVPHRTRTAHSSSNGSGVALCVAGGGLDLDRTR